MQIIPSDVKEFGWEEKILYCWNIKRIQEEMKLEFEGNWNYFIAFWYSFWLYSVPFLSFLVNLAV